MDYLQVAVAICQVFLIPLLGAYLKSVVIQRIDNLEADVKNININVKNIDKEVIILKTQFDSHLKEDSRD